MSISECRTCHHDIDLEDTDFGEPVMCPTCYQWWDTEMELVNHDTYAQWITTPTKPPEYEP